MAAKSIGMVVVGMSVMWAGSAAVQPTARAVSANTSVEAGVAQVQSPATKVVRTWHPGRKGHEGWRVYRKAVRGVGDVEVRSPAREVVRHGHPWLKGNGGRRAHHR